MSEHNVGSFEIKPLSINDIVNRIDHEDFFSFVRVLHGFWNLINRFTREGNPSNYEELKSEMSNPRYQNYATIKSDEIVEMLRNQERSDVLWGVERNTSTSGLCDEMMNLALDESHDLYDGLIWKKALCNGTVDPFIQAINKYKTVIIGLEFLRPLKKRFPVENCDFLGCDVMFSSPKNPTKKPKMEFEEFQEIWMNYHEKQKGEPIVYLTQLSTAGSWIIPKTKFKNSFVFDMGLTLDCWMPEGSTKPRPWRKPMKQLPKTKKVENNDDVDFSLWRKMELP